jgi:hypothetical protein
MPKKRGLAKEILIAAILTLAVAAAVIAIMFSPSKIGRVVLDYGAVLGGLILVVEAVISILLYKKEKFYNHMLRFIRILIGLAMIIIHIFRILPVNIRNYLC